MVLPCQPAEIIPDLVQEEGNYVVTTDLGNEFQGLEAALPGGSWRLARSPCSAPCQGSGAKPAKRKRGEVRFKRRSEVLSKKGSFM